MRSHRHPGNDCDRQTFFDLYALHVNTSASGCLDAAALDSVAAQERYTGNSSHHSISSRRRHTRLSGDWSCLGFSLALDDFSPDESRLALAEIADYVKVDFRASDPALRQEIYDIFRHKKVTFVAEKVETLSELRTAQAEGNAL